MPHCPIDRLHVNKKSELFMEIQLLLKEQSEKYAEKPALIFKETVITFSELKENVFRLANVLAGLGVQKFTKVGICLPNCPEYVYSYLACFCLGAVAVPLDFMLKNDELISCLKHSETKIFLIKNRNDVSLEQIKKNVPSLEKMLLVSSDFEGEVEWLEQYQDLISRVQNDLPAVDIEEKDPALIMYTSGTTGRPKGILLSYKHLEGSPTAMEYFVDLSDKDVKITAIPLSHIAGLIYIQNCVIFGITLIIMGRFNPFEFLGNIQRYKVTCFHIVPAMYTALLSLKRIEKFDLSSLRWVVVFGAPSSPEILERFHKYCPNAQLLNGWGMTETCPPNTVTPLGSNNLASVGKPSPLCQIKLVNDQGQEVGAGDIGEILISGWIVMDSYYNDPDETALVMRDGWLATGDLGRRDQDGFLYIVGRKKEMIKVGGQIVFAPEVEAAFQKHAAVAEVAVIGIPDKLRGESVKAFVVLNEENVSLEGLKYFVREHLAHFKVPQSIEICKELPKNRIGKIDKEALRNQTASSSQPSA